MNISRNSKWQAFSDRSRVATVSRYDGHFVFYRIEGDDELMRVDAITFVRRYERVSEGKPGKSDWAVS
jgi:hypothetical protein